MQSSNITSLTNKVPRQTRKLVTKLNDRRRKFLWRLINGPAEETVPVFIFGAQRSGTSMLGECLGRSPEIENMGETDARAFRDFFIRDDQTIAELLKDSAYKFIVFKPLKDSHRVLKLLESSARAKAVWAYRNYADRINSAVRQFGRHPLEVFEKYKSGQGTAWQLVDLSDKNKRLIERIDISSLTESDGAALLWYVRNALFFDQRLEDQERVMLWSYDQFVTDPEADMRSLARFLGTPHHRYMTGNVHSQSVGKNARPQINPEIDNLCADMLGRLESARLERQ